MQPRIASWGIIKPFSRVGKLNKTLTIPTFSVNCGPIHQSLALYEANDLGFLGNSILNTGFRTKCTLEAWIKAFAPSSSTTVRNIWSYYNKDTGNIIIGIQTYGRKLRCIFYSAGASWTIDSTADIPDYEWTHLAVAYSGSAVTLYINGVATGNGAAGALDVTAGDIWIMGGVNTHVLGAASDIYQGLISTIIGHNDDLDDIEVATLYDKFRNKTAGDGIEDSIKDYYMFDETGSPVGTFYNKIDGTKYIGPIQSPGYFTTSTEYPPIVYGASFIPVQYSVVADQTHSLKFPVTRPDGANFALIVSWLDDNDDLQRRMLFEPEIGDLDINPWPDDYNGEELPEEYTFEIWNIDGQESVDLTTAITIDTSILTDPQNSTDHTQIVLATPTTRTALYEPFPLFLFPLAFDNAATDWT